MARFAHIKEPPPRCSLGKYLDSLPEEDEAQFTHLLTLRAADSTDDEVRYVWGARSLAGFIVEAGDPPIDRDTITNHRRGKCRCRATS